MKLTISRTKALAVAGAAAVLSLAGYGVAYAAIPDGGGVIHGCYKTPVPTHGTPLSIIDTGAGGSCPSGYTALPWSQTGPAGPTGPTGAVGATGATGATGPAGPSTGGSSGLDLQTVTASSTTQVSVACPMDHPFLFGGGASDDSGGALADSQPTGTGQGWFAKTAFATGDSITAYAICGK